MNEEEYMFDEEAKIDEWIKIEEMLFTETNNEDNVKEESDDKIISSNLTNENAGVPMSLMRSPNKRRSKAVQVKRKNKIFCLI